MTDKNEMETLDALRVALDRTQADATYLARENATLRAQLATAQQQLKAASDDWDDLNVRSGERIQELERELAASQTYLRTTSLALSQAGQRAIERDRDECDPRNVWTHVCPKCDPMYGNAVKAETTRTRASLVLRVEAMADELYEALKAYYHECNCRQAKMDKVNQAAYAALRKYENWNGK